MCRQPEPASVPHGQISGALRTEGFVFVPGGKLIPMLEAGGLRDFDDFAKSWDALELDTYMADGGRYRRRRFAAFHAAGGVICRKPHQPHFQGRDYNALNGGVERWFEPITAAIAGHPAMTAVLSLAQCLFDAASGGASDWHVEVHQFRIEAAQEGNGHPTPEGIHRDGVDWVFVMLVARHNIEGGTTTIHDPSLQAIGEFTLTQPMDSVFLDDARIFHGVTEVKPLDAAKDAARDVLVVTFTRETLRNPPAR